MKIEKSRGDKLADLFCVAVLVAQTIFLFLVWQNLPDKVPAHYNFAGEIDRWGSKSEFLLLPILSWLLYFFMVLIEHFPQAWNTGVVVTEENRERVYQTLEHLVSTIKVEATGMFGFLLLEALLTPKKGLPGWSTLFFMALIFGSLFFWIWKLQKVK